MHDLQQKKMFILKFDSDKEPEKIEEENEKEVYESDEDFGGYTPKSLAKTLESVKESIANSNTREALMKLDSCIVRLTKRPSPQMKGDPFTTLDYELDKILPNQGK